MAFHQTKNLWVEQLDDHVAGLVLDIEGSNANFLTPAVLDEFSDALDRITHNTHFTFLVIRSAKAHSFSTGVDPTWLADHATPADLVALAESGQQLCDKLARLPIPSVAVIGGACLGGGLQLALACDYRAAVHRPACVLGFNEVELGLIPCWGGTQRLPRLVGLENSVKLFTSARRLRPSDALSVGLVDEVSAENDTAPPDFLAEPAKRDWSQFPRRNWRQRFLESNRLGRKLILRGAARVLRNRLPDDMPAPWEALEALRVAMASPDLAAGQNHEREAIARLAESAAFRNLLHLRLERDRRRAGAPKPESVRFVRSIGVVGATEAGIDLVRQALLRGCQVVLHDPDKTGLGYASLDLHRSILEGEVKRGTMSQAAALKCLGGFRGTALWEHFDELDLVLDTVADGQRRERFRHLDEITTPATILVSTGAAETVTQLREGLRHPLRVAVLHGAGPPDQQALAELAQPAEAAEPVLRRLEEWVTAQGKMCLRVADRPGLLVMRVWMPAFNEAALLLGEGMAAERIDEAMDRFGAGIGPLLWMDRIGLDAVARLAEQLQPMFGERLTFAAQLAEMARQGMGGARAGAGFYRHAGRQRRPNVRAAALWLAAGAERRIGRPALSHADQLAMAELRMISLMVIEAEHCLREKIVADAATLDFAMACAGWAPHRGGPLTYARQVGTESFVQRLEELARDFGPRFEPPLGFREIFRAVGPDQPK